MTTWFRPHPLYGDLVEKCDLPNRPMTWVVRGSYEPLRGVEQAVLDGSSLIGNPLTDKRAAVEDLVEIERLLRESRARRGQATPSLSSTD